ncbi:MAG: DUF721 domain-containing protein [Abditibacteriota bacterium]|nr:DUF721 domain-containing protein [Abditibacteriota bacterium]
MEEEREPRYSQFKRTPENPFRDIMPGWYPNTKKLYVIIKEWKSYVGEFFYNNSLLLGIYKEGILSVACKDSVISYEMNLNKQTIIDRINAKHGQDYIVDITFNNARYTKKKINQKKEKPKQDYDKVELSAEKLAEIEEALKEFEEGPLKEKIRLIKIDFAKSEIIN